MTFVQPKETANVTNSVTSTNSAWFQTLVNISHAVHVPVSLVARALRHDRHSSTCHLQLKRIGQNCRGNNLFKASAYQLPCLAISKNRGLSSVHTGAAGLVFQSINGLQLITLV